MNGELFLYNCLYELVSKMHFLGQPWGEPQEMSQDRQTDRHRKTQTDRQTDTERHRQTQKDTERHRQDNLSINPGGVVVSVLGS